MKPRNILIGLMITIPTVFLLIYFMLRPKPTYSITDLGLDGIKSSSACSVTNGGQITGVTNSDLPSHTRGFIFFEGKNVPIFSSDGDDVIVRGMNVRGCVVGYLMTRARSCIGFKFRHGAFEKIGSFGGDTSRVLAVNNNGDIVGVASDSNNKMHAFIRVQKKMIDLGSLSGGFDSSATGINDSRQVCGSSRLSNGSIHACLFQNDSVLDLGTLGGTSSNATAINESGEVVGYSEVANLSPHAFITQEGKLKDLGTLPKGTDSYAYGVNLTGTVVGSASDSQGNTHAVVFQRGKMQDLNSLIEKNSDWVLTEARSINDSGDIVGNGIKNGQIHAFVLHPRWAVRFSLVSNAAPSGQTWAGVELF